MPQAPTWDQSEAAPSWADSEDIPSWDESTEEPSKPPATFTLGGREYPLPDQANRPPMPREVSDFAGLPPETSRMEDLKQTLPSPREFIGDVMEPFEVPLTKLGEEEIQRGMFGRSLPESYQELLGGGEPGTTAKIASGLTKAGLGLGETLISPLAVATAGAGALPKAAQRAVSAAFTADMASQVPEAAAAAGEAFGVGDAEAKAEALANLGVAAGFTTAAGLHATAPSRPAIPPRIIEAIAKADQVGLTKSAQAVADVVREQPTKEVSSAVREPIPAEGVLRQERPEVELQGVREPQVEAAIPREPARAQSGEEGQILLTRLIEAVETGTSGTKSGNAREFGRTLTTPEEIAQLKQESSKASQQMTEALDALPPNATDAQMAEVFKNHTFKGQFINEAIEGATGAWEFKGADPVKFRELMDAGKPINEKATPIEQQNAAGQTQPEVARAGEQAARSPDVQPESVSATQRGPAPTAPEAQPARPAGGEPAGRPAVAVPEAVPTPVAEPIGMGGAKASEPVDPRAQLAQLTDSIATLAAEGKSAPAKAFDLGRTLSQAKDSVTSAIDGLKAAGQYMKKRLEGKPVATEYRGVLGDRHLALSESSVNARRWMKDVKKAVPDPLVREAISDWVDTGGDPALLTKAASETKAQYKAGYERAQKLTPEEKVVAENLRNYFDSRLQEAIDAGVLEDGIENYIHRAYEAESPWKKGVIQELRSVLFTGQPALAKKRIFEYDFEAEKLGKKPVKDFAQRVAAYDLALNKSIADRAAVKAMMEIKMSDGRPMIDVGGGGKVIDGPTGEAQATLINRSAKKIDPNDPRADRGDFKPFDHPALRKWKWATEDTAGKPIFVQGDVLIHPEAIKDIRKLLEPSAIRRNPVGRSALGVSSTIKQTMLDLSLFHQVQIAVHALEHRTFGPVKEIDFTNPDVRGLVRGGAVVGETSGAQAFSEGLHGSSLTKHIPWVGERISAYKDYLFSDFIPRIKVAMGLHALERNRSRFKNLSQDELYQLTANQMNAAFGELNYEMMGRSKTMQDALRLGLLAPDFLEARGRFAAQAGTVYGGLPHFREGKFTIGEQGNALLLGAATMYIFARMANKFINDEYHFELKNAFNVIYKGKSYGLRTVQGDLIHAATDPGKFVNHRLNPLYGKPALEFATGRDYFGRKRDAGQKLQDLAMTPIPIAARGVLSGQEQTLLESFLNSIGAVVKRDSPSSDMALLAEKFKKDNKIATGPGEFIYDAEKDPYRPIKLAAERDDEAGARSEIAKAINEGMKRSQIIQHFKLSEKHRFAGSVANERKFLESLTEDQKKIYQDAKSERRRIRELVMRALP